jgi:dTMP kinase
LFITFEGIDGSGKSTQIQLLKNKLDDQGWPVHLFREPGGTTLSENIRDLLLESDFKIHPVTELLLFSAARAQLITEKVQPLLDRNKIVILDRYYDSTTAYQGYGRSSLPLKEIHELNKIASGNLEPDITFYLKITLKEAQKRNEKQPKDRMEQSNNDFYRDVIEGFDTLAEEKARFTIIDTSGSVSQTHRLIMREMEKVLGS